MSYAKEASHLSLYMFVDASQNAYSGCIFLRSEYPDGVKDQFTASQIVDNAIKEDNKSKIGVNGGYYRSKVI